MGARFSSLYSNKIAKPFMKGFKAKVGYVRHNYFSYESILKSTQRLSNTMSMIAIEYSRSDGRGLDSIVSIFGTMVIFWV